MLSVCQAQRAYLATLQRSWLSRLRQSCLVHIQLARLSQEGMRLLVMCSRDLHSQVLLALVLARC